MRRLLLCALPIVAALGLGVAGCSGSSSGGGGFASTAAPVSSAAPFAVLASAPADGEQDVDPAAPLVVTFTADVDPASLAGALELRDDQGVLAASVALVTSRAIEVRPQAALAADRPHLLTVRQALTDAAGAGLDHETLIGFRTAKAATGAPGAPTGLASGNYVAGAAAVDITPPVGVPLGGFGGGDRRNAFPDLNPLNYYTFLKPSVGVKDPIMAKALVLGNGHERVAIVTLDAIAIEAALVEGAVQKARARGFTVPLEKVLACASHTHSGPGAVSKRMFWQLTAADLFVDSVYQRMTDQIADALVRAEQSAGPVVLGMASTRVQGATGNRRAGDSPDLDPDDIDDEMVVLRVDTPAGDPVATVWNFAIHGTHFGTSNHEYSADIMGSANHKVEATGAAGVALFINGAEGDIKPVGGYDATGQLLCDAILRARQAATPQPAGVLASVHEQVDLGAPVLDWSASRQGTNSNINQNAIVQALQRFGLGVGASLALPQGWVEQEFRFQAIRVGRDVIASMPGEPIHLLGLGIKADGQSLGYGHVMAAGLANGHGSYFTTEKEYNYGGYEGLASLFGPKNGQKLQDAARRVMERIRP